VTQGNGLQIDVDLLNTGYRYALSLCANQHDAEDLTHDAWLSVAMQYGTDFGTKVLLSTIRNRFIDQYRRHRNWQIIAKDLLISAQRRQIEAQSEHSVLWEFDLQPHLAKLRPVEREALFLQAVEGYTAAEIAELTSTSRGTILSRISRARAKLQKSIEKQERMSSRTVRSRT